MRFSIIIPVYNVEKYIRKCMDSVMNQTFRDYEVIVVNDETPDNSMAIVQEYVDAFPGQIQVIHQKNTRQGGARNNGVSKARGEYLLFVDSDDYVALNMLETVDAKLQENPCDILVFRHVPVSPEGKLLGEPEYCALEPGFYVPERDKNVVMIPTGPVNKAFRREFYVNTHVQFPEKLLYEDAVTRVFYAMASSIMVCEDVLYFYVQSTNSSIRRNISEKMLDILTVTDITLQEFRQRGLYDAFRDPLDCALIYGILYILDSINSVQPDHPMQKNMADYLRNTFPDCCTNPYVENLLQRAISYLVNYNFMKYHYRILVYSRLRERLLEIPVVSWLNQIRKGRC